MAQQGAAPDDEADSDEKAYDKRGNPTLAHPDVHAAYRDDYDSVGEMLDDLQHQEVRSALNEENRAGNGHGFRVYCTDLPRIRAGEVEPGLLLYDPTHLDSGVYEVTSQPDTRVAQGSLKVETTRHVPCESHVGGVREMEIDQFVSRITDELVPLQLTTVQTALGA